MWLWVGYMLEGMRKCKKIEAGKAEIKDPLPSLGVVSVPCVPGEILVPAVRVDVGVLAHVHPLRVLPQVGHIVRGVAPLEDGIGRRRLLRPLPEEVAAERLGELGREHVAPRRARRGTRTTPLR